MLRPFRLIEPTTLGEAAAELGRLGDDARVYAGGAELILLMRHGVVEPGYLVDVKHISGLQEVSWDGTMVRIGGATTHTKVERDPIVSQRLGLLARAVSTIGNVRVRGQGTLGGNLCFADPHSDPPVPLLVHEAQVVLHGPTGERRLDVDDFLTGTFEVAIEPDEILAAVEIAPLPSGFRGAFLRIERYHRPTVNVASAVKTVDGRIAQARLAVGCVGPRAMRLPDLENRLMGLTTAEATQIIREQGLALAEQLDPVDDLLGSADYKIHVASVLLGRAVAEAMRDAAGRESD